MSDQPVFVRWGEHPSEILMIFQRFLGKNTLVDCTLAAEGQYIKAHKVILSACSSYFELLFTQESDKHPIIILKDVQYRYLKLVLDFVYHGEVQMRKSQLGNFLEVANSLQIKGLNTYKRKITSERTCTETCKTNVTASGPQISHSLNEIPDDDNSESTDDIDVEDTTSNFEQEGQFWTGSVHSPSLGHIESTSSLASGPAPTPHNSLDADSTQDPLSTASQVSVTEPAIKTEDVTVDENFLEVTDNTIQPASRSQCDVQSSKSRDKDGDKDVAQRNDAKIKDEIDVDDDDDDDEVSTFEQEEQFWAEAVRSPSLAPIESIYSLTCGPAPTPQISMGTHNNQRSSLGGSLFPVASAPVLPTVRKEDVVLNEDFRKYIIGTSRPAAEFNNDVQHSSNEHSQDVHQEARKTSRDLLPEKSMEVYEKQFEHFVKWREERGIHGVNEDILLSYFITLGQTCKASSLWCKYSMLRSTLELHEKVHISKFGKVHAYLKTKSAQYTPKKAKTLERQQIKKFLIDAPDEDFLLMKIVFLFGIYGACRCEELTNMTVDDVRVNDMYLSVTIPQSKTNKPRSFFVIRENCPVDAVALYRKYMSLRPAKVAHRRLFLQYRKGKCTVQPAGINKLSSIPKMVASYLKLDDPGSYTGHSLRRTSASLLLEGRDLTLKRRRGWDSSTVIEGYVEDTASSPIKTAKTIVGENTNVDVHSLHKDTNVATIINVDVHPSTSNLLNEVVYLDSVEEINFHDPVQIDNIHVLHKS